MIEQNRLRELLDFSKEQYAALVHDYERETRAFDLINLPITINKMLMMGSLIHGFEQALEIPEKESMLVNGKKKGLSKN